MLGIRNQSAKSLRLRRNLDRIESAPIIATPEDPAFYQSLRRNLGRVEPPESSIEFIESLSIRPNANKLRKNLSDGESAIAADPYWEDTLLFLPGTTSNAGRPQQDLSKNGTYTFGNIVTNSAVQFFGKNTLRCATGSTLRTEILSDFNLQTDFTLEFWFNRISATDTNPYFFGCTRALNDTTNNDQLMLFIGSNSKLAFFNYESGSTRFILENIITISLNTWYFIQIVQDKTAGNIKLYLDGNLLTTQTNLVTNTSARLLRWGNPWDNVNIFPYRFDGYFADIRFTKAIRPVIVPTTRLIPY